MAKKSKKQPETPPRDSALKSFSILGALLLLPCLAPQLPWRMAQMDSNLGGRFTVQRYVSLFSMTNHMQKGVSWMKYRKDVCRKVRELAKPDPVSMLVGAAGNALAGAGGTLAGCAGWAACQEHAMMRCQTYSTMAITGIFCMVLLFVSIGAAFFVPACLSMEASAGKVGKNATAKEREKQEAKNRTMICSILSFATGSISVAAWYRLSETSFKGLQMSGYYPFPAASMGLYLGAAGSFTLFIAMYCGITRVHPNPLFKKAEKKETEEEEYMDTAGMGSDPAMAGMLAPGMPPDAMGMGGPMGAPMGMGGPMGAPIGGPMGAPMGAPGDPMALGGPPMFR